MADILVVYGTRADAIKLGPVVAELRALGVPVRVVCTGQHTTLLRGTPAESDLADGASLGLPSDGDIDHWTKRATDALEMHVRAAPPSAIAVLGDVMSAYAGAMLADRLGVPLAHIEAGVRSHNPRDPWPEEETRVAITRLAQYHYAPTTDAFANLMMENVRAHVYVTGNSVVSALARYTRAMPTSSPSDEVLVTFHRHDAKQPENARAIYRIVQRFALNHPALRVVWPMHPAFRFAFHAPLASMPGVVAPLPYAEFADALASARLVITDSGGVVEEAAALGVPTVIARAANDRPEAVAVGIAVVAAPLVDGFLTKVEDALALPRKPSTVFGTPDAARQIAERLAQLA